MHADTGQIVAAALTRKEVDDGSQVGPLLDQVAGEVSSFTADGAYDQDSVSAASTQRDRHLQFHCQARPPGLAESVGLHHPRPSRSHDRPVQTGDWRRATLTH